MALRVPQFLIQSPQTQLSQLATVGKEVQGLLANENEC